MCKWRTFYAGEDGYVVECGNCQHVQLGFGTVMMTLTRADFGIFCEMVAQRFEDHVPMGNHRKCVVLPTPVPFYQVLLTESELLDLNKMLQLADDEMRVESLLGLFKDPAH